MKIQLDTGAKTIKVESDIKLSELITNLKKLLPNNEWKKFTLQTNVTINNWNYPIIWRDYNYKPYYETPWYCGRTITKGSTKPEYKSGTIMCSLKAGTYNVEI